MREFDITTHVCELTYAELSPTQRRAVDAAKAAAATAYAPYSHFAVGAAVCLANGELVSGSNQENAAYPSGLCAERVTLFYANARFPHVAPQLLTIAARTANGFLQQPISPCGACRQVLIESERRFEQPMQILLYGEQCLYLFRTAHDLLPLSFSSDNLSARMNQSSD